MIEARRRWILTAAAAAAGSALARPAAAQGGAGAQADARRGYRQVNPAQPTEAPAGKIEVLEFFWYGCPHCNSLEPLLNAWVAKLPPDVVFRRVHVPFGDRRHQQLYYTLLALGKADALGDKVFRAIHVENNRLDTVDKMADLVSRNGVDRKRFVDTFESFAVRTRMRRAAQVVDAYGVDGVPAMAVNGKYYTAPSMAGSNQAALRMLDRLIDQERQAGR